MEIVLVAAAVVAAVGAAVQAIVTLRDRRRPKTSSDKRKDRCAR